MAPVSAPGDVVRGIIELHGQQDSTRLGHPAMQRDLLDRYGGEPLHKTRIAYEQAYDAHERARAELEALRTEQRERARERDRLRFELDEIDAVAPEPDEEHELDAQLRRLEHAESLVMAAQQAATLLNTDGGARDALGAAVAGLRGVADVDPALDELHQQLEQIASDTQELGLELSSYADGVAIDPEALDSLRMRRSSLAQLVRKYGADVTQVCQYAAEARDRVAML